MHISTLNYNTRRVVDIKTSKPGHHQKGSHHWTDIISILTKVNVFIRISHYLQPFHRQITFTVIETKIQHVADNVGQHVSVTNQTLHNKTQACRPRMESLKNFSSYVYMHQSRPYIRPLQVVVWFLVHRPHQISDFSNFGYF